MQNGRSFVALILWAVAFFATAGFGFQASALAMVVAGRNNASVNSAPTAVSGESWLNHLHRTFDETSMGKTGQLGPPSALAGKEFARWQMALAPEPANANVTLHGSDLYRMNCRGCHGEQGQGAPPEINSVINPVRATSAAAVMERMKTAGMDISRTDAAKLAQQSEGMLLDRLHHGGQEMPAFPHLGDDEVNSLVAYLRELAGVRGAQQQQVAVRETRVRVGEHIVKSTCHICHNSAGPNPTPQQLYEGAIPPLNTLALRTSRAEFIRKVTHGAPVVMGEPAQLFRGRMPVFYYLSEEEAADVYLYLTRYPPNPWATLDPRPNPTSTASETDPNPLGPATQNSGASFAVNASRAEVSPPTPLVTSTNTNFTALPMLAGLVVIALLGLGLGFTAFELKRLSLATEVGARAARRTDAKNARASNGNRKHASDRLDRELVA